MWRRRRAFGRHPRGISRGDAEARREESECSRKGTENAGTDLRFIPLNGANFPEIRIRIRV